MSSVTQDIIKSVLLIDDDNDVLDMYSELLAETFKETIITSKYPTQAFTMARERLFDIAIIDVTIDYLGSPFGGLDLYKQLLPRYGKSSLISYSQYITDDLLKRYNYNFNFIEKSSNMINFCKTLVRRVSQLRKKQTCFIAMPFDKKYDEVFAVIKKCVLINSYECVRVDQQNFTKSIIDKVFEEISDSKVVIFLANDKNPNAFYECGYAVALGKEVLTITDHYSSLPFDIRDRNAIAYGGDLKKLAVELHRRLANLTTHK